MSDGFGMEQAPKKSSGMKTLIIVLAILGGIGVLACGGCIVGSILMFRNAVSDDPATVQQTAQGISEIELIDGFDPMFSMSMMGIKIAAFGEQGDTPRMIMLMSFPAAMGADEAQMRQQMDQSLQQQTGQKNLTQLESETQTHTIRGEECQVRIAKAEDDDGQQFRQVTTVFKSKDGGAAMLMVLMPEEEWNNGGEEKVDAMLASMK